MLGNNYGSFSLSGFTGSVSVDDVVRALRLEFELYLTEQPIYIGDLALKLSKSITGQGGHRYWFFCPGCDSRVAKLYVQGNVAACRHCLGIKYPSSRYKGMVESQIPDIRGYNG